MPVFSDAPGPRGAANLVKTVEEAFELFFDAEMQDKVVCSTNMKMAKIKELEVNEEDQGKEVYAAVTHIELPPPHNDSQGLLWRPLCTCALDSVKV